jgi:HAD superfamily hydrolase (TIGR01662 family)
MIKTVLFDLDDTLFDYQYSRRSGLKALQGEYPNLRDIPLEELEMTHEGLLQQNYQKTLDRTITMLDATTERIYFLCLKFGLELSGADLPHAVKIYNAEYDRTRRPIPGVEAFLHYLLNKKIKVGVVTNGLIEFQKEKLKVCKIAGLIPYLVISEAVGVRKPDPGIFEAAMERTESKAEETIFIGDSWPTDIAGAYNYGIKAIWLNRYGLSCPDRTMATEINSFLPLRDLVKVIF